MEALKRKAFNRKKKTTLLRHLANLVPSIPFIASGDLVLSAGVITASYTYDSPNDTLEDNPKPYIVPAANPVTNNGTRAAGDTFTANFEVISPSGYTTGYTIQWFRMTERGESKVDIDGATSLTYVATGSDNQFRLGWRAIPTQTATAPANGTPTGDAVEGVDSEVVTATLAVQQEWLFQVGPSFQAVVAGWNAADIEVGTTAGTDLVTNAVDASATVTDVKLTLTSFNLTLKGDNKGNDTQSNATFPTNTLKFFSSASIEMLLTFSGVTDLPDGTYEIELINSFEGNTGQKVTDFNFGGATGSLNAETGVDALGNVNNTLTLEATITGGSVDLNVAAAAGSNEAIINACILRRLG